MESIRPLAARLAVALLCAAAPAAFAQDASVDVQPPRALPGSATYQHVPLIPRDLGAYAAKNQLPPPVAPRQAFGTAAPPTVSLAPPNTYSQTAWLSAPANAQTPPPMPKGEPGLTPKTEPEAPTTPARPAPSTPPQYQTYPAMTAPSAAPSWRWHGYGAVATTDVAQPVTAGAAPPAYTPSQPLATPPKPPAEMKPVDAAPVPMPAAGLNAYNGGSEWVPPGGYTAPPPMPSLPAAPPAAVPLTYLDPVWRSPGDRAAANPMAADPWPHQYQQQQPVAQVGYYQQPPAQQAYQQPASSSFGSAFYPANPVVAAGTPRNYTPRGVSEAPPQPRPPARPPVQQAAFAAPPAPRPPAPAARARTPEPPPAPVRRAEPRPADTLGQFKAAIERVCAGKGYDVELSAKSSASMLLKMKVRKAADAEFLAARVAQIPELGPYQISYEIQVAP